MFQQVPEQGVRQAVLIGPGGVTEDAVKRFGVCLLNPPHCLMESLSDVAGYDPNILPVTTFRDLKAVVLRKQRILLVAPGLVERSGIFLIEYIRDALEKQQRKYIGLEV